MIHWDEIEFVSGRPRPKNPVRPRNKRRISPPIPPLRALIDDLPCTFCNADPHEPCHRRGTGAQVKFAHPERRQAALNLRNTLTGAR